LLSRSAALDAVRPSAYWIANMRLVGVVGRSSMPPKSLAPQAAISSPAVAAVARRDGSSPLLAICNATVALYKQAFGRGPTKVQAHYAGPDTIVVLLEQTLTAAERNLVTLGEQDRLRESRLIVQRALEDRLRETVEGALGRRAIAVMSAIHVDRDVCAEILTLEPRAGASAV
jgi:uncharacterized protein YbcI